jgi:uncharacterized Zn-binding protein involved in type VI secretion
MSVEEDIVCDKHPVPPSPKGGGTIAPRVSDRLVRIGMKPAAREGDEVICVGGGKENIVDGEPSVRIEGKKAARMTDPIGSKMAGVPIKTGKILIGCPTVFIGSVAQTTPLLRAAENGTPFCEECERGST